MPNGLNITDAVYGMTLFTTLYRDLVYAYNYGIARPGFAWRSPSPVTIETLDEKYIYRVEMPGVRREHVDVSLTERLLQITARGVDTDVYLPKDADADDIRAMFNDGLLTLHVLRARGPRTKKISIQAA